jgi:hypothetical protein
MFIITALVKYFFALMGGNHGVIRGRSPLKDEWTILVELRSYVVTRENGAIKTVRIFLRC